MDARCASDALDMSKDTAIPIDAAVQRSIIGLAT
jgi:hypothetical protein